ncbi:MAG TPA: DEAD/DEAH box helicase [Longimicrobiales bacterium]|nr:DEAD/DEAH box helicase [Longimicrobiales bacterium]
MTTIAPAAGVVLYMMKFTAGEESLADSADLTRFQHDAAARLQRIMALRGGAMLADSVGLGKTHVALAFIRKHMRDGGTAAVIAPAALRSHWHRHLRSVPGCRFLSHSALSRASSVPKATSLIVVDEAHAFRNPRTRRYAVLARLCAESTVLLLTATPVNNSLFDFYHLLRLFSRDDSFCDIGVPDLRATIHHAANGGSAEPLRNVARHVMVRRSRAFIERNYGPAAVTPGGAQLRFPERQPLRAVRYDLGAAYPAMDGTLASSLAALSFPVHAVAGQPVPADLLRLGLLKRLESSTAAFMASLRAYEQLLTEFMDAAQAGYLLDARSQRSLMPAVGGAVQLAMRGVVLRRWPPERDRAAYIASAGRELQHVRHLAANLDACRGPEPKLAALKLILPEFAGERVLVFTEYRHTARMLWRGLRNDGGVALIAGDEARLGGVRASRRAVLQRFTTAGSRVPQHQQVRILVATDVLSEGLNLQQARVVISYDVPWNPVRLAQRIGRIDRLGSPHPSIVSVVFVPDRRLDAVLRLMERIRRKVRHIRVVGGDTPWTSPRPTAQAGRVLDDGALETDARLRVAGSRARQAGIREACGPAAVLWDRPYRGALVCVANGSRTWMTLCREGRTPDLAGNGGESVAVAILEGRLPGATGAPDTAWLDRMARTAAQAIRRSLDGSAAGGAAGTAVAARAARIVHRWLRNRAADGDDRDCATSERILEWLAAPLSATDELRLRSLLQGTGADDTVVRQLETVAAGSGGARSAIVPGDDSTGLIIVASVELVPGLDHPREAVDRPQRPCYLG